MTKIPVNIWDDYYDDNRGKPQETFAYIEDYDIPEETKFQMLKIVHKHLLTLNLTGVTIQLDEDRINLSNLTHVRRELLVDELKASKLEFEGKPFMFYSES